jgi:hypothetical protein
LCLGQIDFEVGKRCKYLINKRRIWAKSALDTFLLLARSQFFPSNSACDRYQHAAKAHAVNEPSGDDDVTDLRACSRPCRVRRQRDRAHQRRNERESIEQEREPR